MVIVRNSGNPSKGGIHPQFREIFSEAADGSRLRDRKRGLEMIVAKAWLASFACQRTRCFGHTMDPWLVPPSVFQWN